MFSHFLAMYSASASLVTTEEKQAAEKFGKECTNQAAYSIGKAFPTDGNVSAWINSVTSSPGPLIVTLESLGSLLPLKKYLNNTPEVMSNIEKVLQDYCTILKSEDVISSCNEPGKDPPFPGTNS